MEGVVSIVSPGWTKQIATTSAANKQSMESAGPSTFAVTTIATNDENYEHLLKMVNQGESALPSASIATASTSVSNPP